MAISATHRTSNDKISFRQETIVIKIEFPDWIFALRPLGPAVIQTFTPTLSAQDFFSSPEIGVLTFILQASWLPTRRYGQKQTEPQKNKICDASTVVQEKGGILYIMLRQKSVTRDKDLVSAENYSTKGTLKKCMRH